MDQIQAMRIFVRVVEAGTFTRAADSLDLPKGTVTKQIQALEAHLRVKLLNRTTRRVTVTPDGAAYFERTARLLNDFDEIEASMTNAQAKPAGRLRIDVGTGTARLVLLPALPAFHARYADLQIDLGVSDRTIDLIGESVDCVIRGGELRDLSLKARHVGDLQLGVYAAPAYLARNAAPAHPRELEHGAHRVVGFLWGRTGKTYPVVLRRDDETLTIDAPYVVAVDDGNAYLAAGLAGMGVLWLPRYMAKPHVASGELLPLLEDWRLPPMPLHVAYPQNRYVSTRLRVFIDWVADLMAEHAPIEGR